MRRAKPTQLSPAGQQALAVYDTALRTRHDLAPKTILNYLSDLRQFAAWCEQVWHDGCEVPLLFGPATITTPTLTHYRSYLQLVRHLRPASINRALITIKHYTAWALSHQFISYDPATVVKLVPEVVAPPRHLSDQEEAALIAVLNVAPLRDRTMFTLMLHTGLRASELCQLEVHHLSVLGKRSGWVQISGKRNKQRAVPLNATARAALAAYMPVLPLAARWLFPSMKTGQALTVRGLAHCFARYVKQARLTNVSLHDLRHRFGYRMAAHVPIHRLAQLMGHDSLDTTSIYTKGTAQDLQQAVETIAWQ